MEFLEPEGIDLRRAGETLEMLPPTSVITDCKSLYDSLERSESLGLGMTDRRTSIDVAATREQMRESGITCRWVNSHRQLADALTKPMPADNIQRWPSSGRWKIVFDEQFVAAKKVKRQQRDAKFTPRLSTIRETREYLT